MRFEGWHVSFDALMQLVGMFVVLIGLYWKMREMVFKLHNENKEAMGELREDIAAIKTQVTPLWRWFTEEFDRRRQR